MALRHWDGFSAYRASSDLDALYVREGAAANLSVVVGGGPSGLGAVRLGEAGTMWAGFYRTITSSSEIIVGFWFNYLGWDGGTYGSDSIFKANYGATDAMEVRLFADGTLKVFYSGYSEIFSSADPAQMIDGMPRFLEVGREYRIELRLNPSSTVGKVELHVDGVVWCNLTGISINGYSITRLIFQTGETGEGASFEVSEIYCFDPTTGINTDFLTTWKAQILRPTSDDGSPGFTNGAATYNYENVDDAPDHDADGTINYSTANAQIDLFATTGTLDGGTVRPIAANVVNIARHEGTAQKLRNVCKHSATSSNGADVALTADFLPLIQSFETCPSTSTAWTKAQIEAAKFGYESRA